MSIPERTGRATTTHNCRKCGPAAEAVAYEVRDPENGAIGDEVMCLTCGRLQWRWAIASVWSGQGPVLDAAIHREFLNELAVTVWLAARLPAVLEQHGLPQPAGQLDLFRAVA